MSLLLRRQRDLEAERDQALIGMREAVIAAMPRFASLGSDPIPEAVDEALDQLRAAGKHLVVELPELKRLWILYANRRLIDRHRSVETKYRDRAPIDEHVQALAVSAQGNADIGGPSDKDPAWWRALEILEVLPGKQGTWGRAYFNAIEAGQHQPRGLAQELGWSETETEKISQRARAKMEAFHARRASGAVCNARQATLDAFILAGQEDAPKLSEAREARFRAILVHLMGCEDCRAAWQARRRSLLGRYAAIFTLPLGHAAAAAAAVRDRVAGLLGGAHHAAFSLRQRLSVGGGASATVAGGGAATFGTKAAALCGAAVCAVGGGTAAVVTELPSLLTPPVKAHHQARHHAAKAASALAAPAATQAAAYTTPVPSSVTPQPQPATPVAARPAPKRTGPDPTYTPGDLSATGSTPAASSASSSPAPRSVQSTVPTPPASSNPSNCVPGDLAC